MYDELTEVDIKKMQEEIDHRILVLRPQYQHLDAGSAQLTTDAAAQSGCRCAQVITGAIPPTACPLFGTACTPGTPRGACMVSGEGSCHNAYLNHRM